MKEPRWVLGTVVRAIHSLQLTEHGGRDGIRDEGLLDSALSRPTHVFQYNKNATIADIAAAYGYGIARNHAFIDGNKRTAAVVCELFLEMNGKSLRADDEDLYSTFMAVAEGSMSEEELTAWLRNRIS